MRAQGLVVKVHNKVPMKSEGHLGKRRDASPIGLQAASTSFFTFNAAKYVREAYCIIVYFVLSLCQYLYSILRKVHSVFGLLPI